MYHSSLGSANKEEGKHLDVALGAEGPALEERLLHVHAPLVHIRPRLEFRHSHSISQEFPA